MKPVPNLNVWNDDDLAEYIVEFLLPLDDWMILGYALTQVSGFEKDEINLTRGFTWHVWTLPNNIFRKIFKLRQLKERSKIN